ncbi:MAG: Rib/alpha-like domain-containing protein [Planctomycetota bacterium]|nr:Rib/alpha-like domain-containing protein [Planctomycetota bacterium]
MFEIVSNDNAGLFSTGPSLSSTGRLTFTPATNRDGIANLTVRLKDSGGIANGGDDTSDAVPLRITVNNVPPSLSIAAASSDKDEGDSGNTPFTFTLSRSGDVSSALDAIYTVTGSGGSPTDTDDFGGAFPSGLVHFDANETTAQIITINVGGEGVVERDEEFTVTLSDATIGAVISTPTAIGTIRNDDSATVSISGPDPTNEGDSGIKSFDFMVTLSNPVDVAVSLQLNTTDGTATTANNDYSALSESITFQPGESLSQTKKVQVNGDTAFEPDETFTVSVTSLNANSRDVSLGTSTANATIHNDDRDPNLGEIRGLKWWDKTPDGVYDPQTEPGLGGWTIYIDANKNSSLDWTDGNSNGVWDEDEGEQWTVTGSDGTYVLPDVPAGSYIVREVTQDGWQQTYPNTSQQEAPSEGLVAYYPLDGDLNDASGNGNHGSLPGASDTQPMHVVDRHNIPDGALEFDGGDYFTVNDSPSLDVTTSVTFAAWVYPDRVDGGYIINKSTNGYEPPFSLAMNNQFQARVNNSPDPKTDEPSFNVHSDAVAQVTVWTHVAGVYDGSELRIYVDGVASSDSKEVSGNLKQSNEPLQFGCDCGGGGVQSPFDGTIDDVRIYNRALSAEEILTLANDATVVGSVSVVAGQPTLDVNFGNKLLPSDFGDAPDSYSTTIASNGARHLTGSGPTLGTRFDHDLDGQPNASATDDDTDNDGDDEDGLVDLSSFVLGEPANLVIDASAAGKVDAWMDMNGNGMFDHPAEYLGQGTSIAIGQGENRLDFTIPSRAIGGVAGDSYLRIRISTDGGLGPGGYAADGEVEDYAITILDSNHPPILGDIGDKSVDELSELNFTATATDEDTPPQKLTFSLGSGAPNEAHIDEVTGKFSWTPTEEQGPKDYDVTICVTDDGSPPLSDCETFAIIVNEVNERPELQPIGNQSIDEETLLTFTATATDDDVPANRLTFSLDEGAPSGASIDPDSGVFTWTPSESQGPGTFPVTVRVTDDGTPKLSAFETIEIVVREVNQPPEIIDSCDWSVEEGNTLTCKVEASDPDIPDNDLTFGFGEDAAVPAGASIDPSSGIFTWTPTEAQGPMEQPLTVCVTDDAPQPLEVCKSITIEVTDEHPWQNFAEPRDVNADEFVSPLDVLIIINDLNANGARALPDPPTGLTPHYLDVNGDGYVSPLDVLIIINLLEPSTADSEGATEIVAVGAPPVSQQLVADSSNANRDSTDSTVSLLDKSIDVIAIDAARILTSNDEAFHTGITKRLAGSDLADAGLLEWLDEQSSIA